MNAVKPPGLALESADGVQVIQDVVGPLDVAVHHRGRRAKPAPVRFPVDLEPAGRPALLRRDALPHPLGQDLGPPAGQRALPRVPKAREDLAHGEGGDTGHGLDLGGGEEVGEHARKTPPGLPDEVEVVVEGESRVVPALEEDGRRAPLHGPADLGHDLVDGERVGLRVSRLPVEGAELTVGDADVRVVGVRVDGERHLASGMEAAAHPIGELTQLEQGGLGQEPPALLAGEAGAVVELGADRLEHRAPVSRPS